ncbi:MAG: hypothetical protein GXY48_12265 [Methanomicrobiales archaeon]|nr:hypothetical protein [Methanomicrobiales archaeon]
MIKLYGVHVLILLSLAFCLFPSTAAEISLTCEDESFLSDMQEIGMPMLHQIPEAMNTGVFYGRDSAIADIAFKKKQEVQDFTDKISAYTLSADVSQIRDLWLTAGQTLEKSLDEYGSLTPGCGSCVASMNAMYPELVNAAQVVQKDLVSFYVKNQISP